MSTYYFDSSAIAKRYLIEPGTGWVNALHIRDDTEAIYTANISRVEVASAITQRRRAKAISGSAWERSLTRLNADFQSRYAVLAVEDETLDRAETLVRTLSLRAYDAIQLATALFIDRALRSAGLEGLTFVSADNKLNEAARLEGLAVENPNDHDS